MGEKIWGLCLSLFEWHDTFDDWKVWPFIEPYTIESVEDVSNPIVILYEKAMNVSKGHNFLTIDDIILGFL